MFLSGEFELAEQPLCIGLSAVLDKYAAGVVSAAGEPNIAACRNVPVSPIVAPVNASEAVQNRGSRNSTAGDDRRAGSRVGVMTSVACMPEFYPNGEPRRRYSGRMAGFLRREQNPIRKNRRCWPEGRCGTRRTLVRCDGWS